MSSTNKTAQVKYCFVDWRNVNPKEYLNNLWGKEDDVKRQKWDEDIPCISELHPCKAFFNVNISRCRRVIQKIQKIIRLSDAKNVQNFIE